MGDDARPGVESVGAGGAVVSVCTFGLDSLAHDIQGYCELFLDAVRWTSALVYPFPAGGRRSKVAPELGTFL